MTEKADHSAMKINFSLEGFRNLIIEVMAPSLKELVFKFGTVSPASVAMPVVIILLKLKHPASLKPLWQFHFQDIRTDIVRIAIVRFVHLRSGCSKMLNW